MMRVATIPPDLCFVTTLAQGLWRRVDGDPLALSSFLIFLPTRRACRHLREAFLRVTGARAALLPRMQPLGDVDEVDLDFAGAGALDDIPPALPPLRRQMLLMQLVLAKEKNLPLDQAAALAQALGLLLDQAQAENCDFATLDKLVPKEEAYSEYWKQTLAFLQIITHHWPDLLKKEGCIDPVQRRTLVLEAQAAQWRREPPAYPVIAAGSTGSVPSVGRLMQVIAALENGEVILPGLDLTLDDPAWGEVKDTHPQFTMKSWLAAAGVARKDVRLWENVASKNPARVRLLQESARPAEVSEHWRDLTQTDIPPVALDGLEKIELDHVREEADVIAVRLRAALEEEGKTAALITPDRSLAARVEATLTRWGITANDSAGSPLDAWPVGSFLIDVLRAAAPAASPVACLALLKHPLAACGLDPLQCRHYARQVEMDVWRGVRREGGWLGAATVVEPSNKELAAWLRKIHQAFAPLTDAWREPQPVSVWIDRHLALAEFLAATHEQTGPARLWRGEAGEAAVTWLDDWRGACEGFAPVTVQDYARLCEELMHGVVVRPGFGQHPRLSILGPLEARLLHHDLVILGGLNEGIWPPAAAVDPWMSRPMKRDFGLPLPERRMGQSAHDFVQLCAAPNVLITRARRSGGSPSVPSRLLLQLETVLQASGYQTAAQDPLAPRQPWRAWARLLDTVEGDARPMARPSPRPPVSVRPQKLSVTEIGTWMRNPYAIYAKHVLGLKKLEDIDADVSAADQGTAIHAALEAFVLEAKDSWPANPLEALLDQGRAAFAVYSDRPQIMAFWWPKFESIAAWFVAQEEKRRAQGIRTALVEGRGVVSLQGGSFALTGRADRVDVLPDGSVEIIDYKTGKPPSTTDVMTGYEPQLALLGLMAAQGGFKDLGDVQARKLSYWALKDQKETVFEEHLEDQIARAQNGLIDLLNAFGNETTPYEAVPRPVFAPAYDDYAHLARLTEWGKTEGGEE